MADGAARAAAAAEVMSSSSSFLCSCDRESHHSLVTGEQYINGKIHRNEILSTVLARLRCAINEMLHRRVYSSAHLQYSPFHLQIDDKQTLYVAWQFVKLAIKIRYCKSVTIGVFLIWLLSIF